MFLLHCKDDVNVQGDVNLTLRENSKKSSSPIISTEASFNYDRNEDTLNVIKVS